MVSFDLSRRAHFGSAEISKMSHGIILFGSRTKKSKRLYLARGALFCVVLLNRQAHVFLPVNTSSQLQSGNNLTAAYFSSAGGGIKFNAKRNKVREETTGFILLAIIAIEVTVIVISHLNLYALFSVQVK